jgi:hypothetical protein
LNRATPTDCVGEKWRFFLPAPIAFCIVDDRQAGAGLRFFFMTTNKHSPTPDEARNADPLTHESGAHPVATGVGAAAIGAAGLAAAAAVAGPVGVAAAVVGGAIIGGYVGKAAGELIDPTVEDAYWREQHPQQPYGDRTNFQDYALAYRTGYEGYQQSAADGRTFDEAELELRTRYENGGGTVPWSEARNASRAAWERVHRRRTEPAVESGVGEAVISENLQSGALSNAQMPR